MKKETLKESMTNFKKAWVFARNQKKFLIGYFIFSFCLCSRSKVMTVIYFLVIGSKMTLIGGPYEIY